MKTKKVKKLEKEIEAIDKELALKKKESDELQHLLIKRINQDVRTISKLINPMTQILSNLTERVERLEENTIDKEIDDAINEYVH